VAVDEVPAGVNRLTREEVGALWPETRPGDTIRVWIVDVNGTRLFIEAETTKQAGSDLEQEIQQIIESIRFD
jgi:hypothetical protein